MKLPVRMTCAECGRSATWSSEGLNGAPSACVVCGGPVEPVSGGPDFELVTALTPASLQLTPDEAGAESWNRESERKAPASVGRFQIRDLLGNGGFGHVYRAFDSRLERDIALKVLRESRPPARVIERFFREARAAAQLDHPNIVGLFDAGRDDGKCWIAYQYVAGVTLGRYRENHARDHRITAAIICDLADALDHAHGRGVFYRDLKPANILIDDKGRPRLTDFGLARRIDFEETMTREGAILGTIPYMSPEQKSGNSHQADGRSDLYSLGVIFYEMLCGRRPFDAPSNAASWHSAPEQKPITRPKFRDRTIPRELDRICLKALAIEPENRYENARLMADDIRDWLELTPTRSTRALMVAGLFLVAILTREGMAQIVKRWPVQAVATAKAIEPQPEKPIAKFLVAEVDPPKPVEASTEVIANLVSRKYHLFKTCSHVKGMKDEHKLPLPNQEEAISRKFDLCIACSNQAAKSR